MLIVKTVICVTIIAFLTSCSNNNSSDVSTLKISGSTTLVAVTEEISQLFEKNNSNIIVEVQGIGSSAGISGVSDGISELGMTSRELKGDELDWGLTLHTMAYDAIAVIVHPENPVVSIDVDDIKKIFEGDITNWNEVGGLDAPITVISREYGGGTRASFEEIVGINNLYPASLIFEGNGAIKGAVSSKKNSIGYVSSGIVDNSVKLLLVDEVEITQETARTGIYKLSRPLYYVSKGEITENSKKFLDFALSEDGQACVSNYFVTILD